MSYTAGIGTLALKTGALSIAQATTDIASWSGLPASLRITKFTAFSPSGTLAVSAATIGLFDASGGGGNGIAAAALLTALTTTTGITDLTLTLPNLIITTGNLFVRNVIAGAAATCRFRVEYVDLT